jgi:hypothetical protein
MNLSSSAEHNWLGEIRAAWHKCLVELLFHCGPDSLDEAFDDRRRALGHPLDQSFFGCVVALGSGIGQAGGKREQDWMALLSRQNIC